MKKIAIITILFATATLIQAQTSLNYPITQPRLWDVTGQPVIEGSDTTLTLTQSTKGIVTGTAHETMDGGTVTINSTIKGKITGTPGSVKFSASLSGTVTGTYQGTPITGKETATLSGIVSSNSPTMAGHIKSKISVKGLGTQSDSSDWTLDMPAGMDGDWSIGLVLTNIQNKITGTATVALSNGRSFSYGIKGTANPSTGIQTLKLAGMNEAKGTSFVLTLGANNAITKLNGSLMGQKLMLP